MPSDTRNRSPSPPSRGTAGIDRHNRSRSPKRHQKEGADSPAEVHRYRSRSPRPRSPPADEEAKPRTKKSASGFKFKERTTGEGHHDKDKDRGHMTKGLERGYRDKGGEGKFRPSAHSSDAVSEKFGVDASVKDKFGDVKVPEVSGNSITGDKPAEAKREKRKEKSKPSVAQPALEMIVVYVNDRLGTRAQIMCSPSDTIKDFKAFTAQKIGRQPHEIMVKRQGERPFRDQLTLEDYGVGNGVQLDLELDTGD